MFTRLLSHLRVLIRRRTFEDGMTEELRFHIEQYTADLVRSGMPPEEAARRARIEFGGIEGIREDCREARGLGIFDEARRDLRHAFRSLRKTPGFTATALLTLALCIGANLTIFAAIDAILLRPLPFPEAGRLVTLFNTYPKAGVDRDGASVTNYYERRGRLPAFSNLAIYRYGSAITGDPGSTVREPVTEVSPDFFATLGIGPAIGRTFTDDETTYQTDRVVILTDAYWRQHFSADPNVVGRQLRMDGFERTVVGVLPPNFRFLSSESRLYIPRSSNLVDRTAQGRHSGSGTEMIARLRPGVDTAEAQSQIDAQNAALAPTYRQPKMMADAGFRTIVTSLHADHVKAVRPILLLMQIGVLVLLLIGAVNLVNLLLIRASGRIRELAVRQAMGASRRHVFSEVMVETTLLTTIGGLLGLAVGAAGIDLLAALGAEKLPLGAQIAFDGRLALVAFTGAVALGIVVGLPVAWFNLRSRLAPALQSVARGGTSGRAAQRLRHAFIVAQIALAFVLLAGAGLLGLSLKQAMAVSPGFRADHILSGQISLPWATYPNVSTRLAFTDKLMNEIGHQPGVSAAGVVTNVPLSGQKIKSAITVQGYVPRPGESVRGHYAYSVAGDYFAALGFSLQEGRFLSNDDSHRPERVCVVDVDFARRYWPDGGPIGHKLFLGGGEKRDADAFTVVGLVGAVKQAEITESQAQGAVYFPYSYRNETSIFVVTRTSTPPENFANTLRNIVRGIDPDLPVNDIQSMDTRISDSLVARRSPALLAGIFAAVALLLTAIGTYGVLSYAVSRRRREIGIRMALGARPQQIRSQFLSLALRLLAAGTILGVFGAWLTGKAMQTVLFNVPSLHLATLAAAICIMALVSLVACLLPSHRAARISPMETLADQ